MISPQKGRGEERGGLQSGLGRRLEDCAGAGTKRGSAEAEMGHVSGQKTGSCSEFVVGDERHGDLFVLCRRKTAAESSAEVMTLDETRCLHGPEAVDGAAGKGALSEGTLLSTSQTQMSEVGNTTWCEFSEIPEGWLPVEGLELKDTRKSKAKRKGRHDTKEGGTGKGVEYDQDGRPVGAK